MGSAGVKVSGGDTSLPYISMNSENPIQGMVRVWGTDLQVFNGSSWAVIPTSYATATLDNYAVDMLDWVRKKMLEEKVLEALSNDNPAVKLAKENINRIKQELARAEEQLKITELLSQDE
jgi:3-dehydroquinate synthase class II